MFFRQILLQSWVYTTKSFTEFAQLLLEFKFYDWSELIWWCEMVNVSIYFSRWSEAFHFFQICDFKDWICTSFRVILKMYRLHWSWRGGGGVFETRHIISLCVQFSNENENSHYHFCTLCLCIKPLRLHDNFNHITTGLSLMIWDTWESFFLYKKNL